MWTEVEIAEAVELILDHRGRTPKKLGADFVAEGVQVISAQNLTTNRLDLSATARFVTPEVADRWMPTPLAPGDVLLSSEAPLGCVARIEMTTERLCLGQRLFALRPNSGLLDSGYLEAALRSEPVRSRLLSRASGTTAQGIKQSELRQVLLPIPPLRDQRAIAAVLGAIDAKIESNRKLADICHATVLAEFDHRFGADWPASRTRGKPAIGGEWGTVGDLVELRYGKALKAEIRAGGPIAVVGSSGIVGAHNRSLVSGPVVVVGRKGVAGSVIWVDEDAWPIDTTFYAVPRDGRPLSWLYGALLAVRLIAAGGDSAVPGLNRATALARTAVVPPIEACVEFDRFAAPLLTMRAGATSESGTLTAIRDALLPKLVSGKIRVPLSDDPEEQVGAAVEALRA